MGKRGDMRVSRQRTSSRYVSYTSSSSSFMKRRSGKKFLGLLAFGAGAVFVYQLFFGSLKDKIHIDFNVGSSDSGSIASVVEEVEQEIKAVKPSVIRDEIIKQEVKTIEKKVEVVPKKVEPVKKEIVQELKYDSNSVKSLIGSVEKLKDKYSESDYVGMIKSFNEKNVLPILSNNEAFNGSNMNKQEKSFYQYLAKGISRNMRLGNCDSVQVYCDHMFNFFRRAYDNNVAYARDNNAPGQKNSWFYYPLTKCGTKVKND